MDVWPDRGERAASLPAGGGSLGVYGRGELVSGRERLAEQVDELYRVD